MNKKLIILICLVLISSLTVTGALAQKPEPPDTNGEDLPDHVPGELLISFNPGVNSVQKMNEHGLEHVKEIQPLGVHLVKLPPGLSVEKALERFNHLPGVAFAEPNFVYQITATTQTEISDQWGLAKINAEAAWGELPVAGRNPILLATVDTGVDRSHSDLSDNIWVNELEIQGNSSDDDGNGFVDDTWGWDFVNGDNDPDDDNMHGTGVSSVMAGIQDGAGVAGVCPWCRVMAVKVLGANGSGSLDIVAQGINYAAQMNAKVINLSLTGPSGSTMEAAVDNAWNSGAVVVAAAGNNGLNTIMYPSGYAKVMGVASTDENDYHSCFSNHAENSISVSAPGERILMAEPNQSYGIWSGTSLSAPHVVGLAGLVLSQNPALTNDEVRTLIETSADDLGPPGVDAAFGHGRINALRALDPNLPSTEPEDGVFSISDTASGYAHARKLVRDDLGTLHMIWHTKEGSSYRIRYANSTDDGVTWNLMDDAYSSPNETYHPALATDGDFLYAAIPSKTGPEPEAHYQILFTRKPLPVGDWEAAVPLMGGAYHTVRPDMYLDPTNGRLHVIASSLDHAVDSTSDLYYRASNDPSNDQGTPWEDLRIFSPSNSTPKTRYATLHANGDKIYVVARTVTNIANLIYYYYMHTVRSIDGGVTWIDQDQKSSFIALTSGEYGISLAGVGDRMYIGYEVGSNLYFRRNDGAGWSDYLELETGAPTQDPPIIYKWPTITQAEDGQAWLMFEENKQLYMRHYDGSNWAEKESMGSGTYANFKLGTSAGQVEWIKTGCNSSPFELIYGSRSLSGNIPPTASFTYTTSELSADFSDASFDSDGTIISWAWDFGDGNNSTLQNPSHTYSASGTYPVSLTVTDNDGATDTALQNITVTETPNLPPTASFTYSADDLQVTFSDASSDSDGTIVSWAWDFGDGYGSTLQDPMHTYSAANTYPVSLTVTDNDGATDTMNQDVTVTSNATPTASFSFSTADLIASFTDTSSDSDGTIGIWDWNFGDGNTSTSQNPEHTYASAGTYTVSLMVTDNDGATDSMNQDVTVTTNAAPTASFSFSTADLIASFTDTSSDSDGTIVNWDWDFGDLTNSTAQNPSHTYGAAGDYTISLIVTDNDGDSDSVSQSVTVTDPPILIDAMATDEIHVAGTVSGDYSNTHEDGGAIEAITERDSGGKKNRRFSHLEHKWTFEVNPGNAVTLYANAWSSGSDDLDSFIFAYSTDDANYTDMFTVANTTDSGYESYPLKASIQGTVYVRVIDSDHNAGNRLLDTVFVDHLYIRSETQPGDPPTAPYDLSAEAVSATQINLLWIDISLDEYGFQIDRSLDSTNWSQIDSVDANITVYIDTTVSPNTTYSYRVRAYNGSGSSDYSNEAIAITLDGLSVTANGYKVKGVHVVDLEWSGSTATSFDIYRDGRNIDTVGENVTIYSDNTGNKGGASYQYQVCEAGTQNCSNTVQVDF